MSSSRENVEIQPRLEPEVEIETGDQSRNPVIYSAEQGCLATAACIFVLIDGFAQGDLLKVIMGGGGLLFGSNLKREINPRYRNHRG